jgi:radical SAM superfamily enzyme YgiQ (UPF0313 family)
MMREGRIVTEAVAADMANPRFEDARCRILIVRLSPYRDIEVSYSHLVLFDESRRAMADAFIDFAFLPLVQDRKALTAKGVPWFYGRASGKSPAEFDIILISCAFTLELINLPWLLSQSGIPASRGERLRASTTPFLFLGGSSAVTAGSVLKMEKDRVRESLVDAFFFGEGEGRARDIVRIASDGLLRGASKAAILARIASEVEGFWPCDSRFVTVRALPRQRPHALVSPLILNGENAGHVKLAITAGCSGHCAFCLEGWDRRPFREKPLQELSEAGLALKRATGASDVELFSYNFNMHHQILALIPAMGRYFFNVSLMSQRLDILARSPQLLAAEFAAGKRSFTLGIEGISDRLRQYYHKGISGAQIWGSVSSILRRGARELKLFFIISGFENEADLAELDAFCGEMARFRDETRVPTRIIVSAGYLVRLPFTPLQFAPLAHDRTVIERIASRVEALCAENSIEFRLASSFEDYWLDQLLSIAGPLAHDWLSVCPEHDFVYDLHVSRRAMHSLDAFLAKTSKFSMLLEEKLGDYRPCFSFVESEAHWNLLREHYERSKKHLRREIQPDATQPQMPGFSGQTIATTAALSVTREMEARRALALITAQKESKAHFSHVIVKVREDDALAFSTESYECAWLIRALSGLVPASERALFNCRRMLPDDQWSTAFPAASASHFGLVGEKYFALYGPDAATLEKIAVYASNALKSPKEAPLSNQRGIPATAAATSPSTFLTRVELVKTPPVADSCMLLCTLRNKNDNRLGRVMQSWLDAQGLRFILNTTDNGHEFHISENSLSKKSVLFIKYHTHLSNIVLRLHVGKRVDLQAFSDVLQKEFPNEELFFRIESWA